MDVSEFDYDLPAALIAQSPPANRADSRLLLVPAGEKPVLDRHFRDLIARLCAGDLLVVNDTRVIRARLLGRKTDTGGQVEILVEHLPGGNAAVVQVKASKSPSPGTVIETESGSRLVVTGRLGAFFGVESLDQAEFGVLLEKEGHVPLPPYIDRPDQPQDQARYQTIYARVPGAVAAPTAGLHFDREMLDTLAGRGIQVEALTLHVGAATFQPVRCRQVSMHRMHSEQVWVGQRVVDAISSARRAGRRVIAVGTTVVRALESAALEGSIAPLAGQTDLFIYPGFEFKVVDVMITNFHLPRSSLLMLVSAFAGTGRVRQAYAHAIRQRYRFFSYGDAMLLEKKSAGK